MLIIIFEDFVQNYNLKGDTLTESDLQKVYIHLTYPREAKIYSDRGCVSIDNGSMGGSHRTTSYVEKNEPFYIDSFGGQPHKFLLNQLPKPIFYLNYKIQDISSKICGSYCFFSSI